MDELKREKKIQFIVRFVQFFFVFFFLVKVIGAIILSAFFYLTGPPENNLWLKKTKAIVRDTWLYKIALL